MKRTRMTRSCQAIETESQSHRHPGRSRPGFRILIGLIVLGPGLAWPSPPAGAQESPPSNEELARRIETLAQELEDRRHGDVATALASYWGLGPAASKVYAVDQGLSFGGYGEALYQNFADERQNDQAAAQKSQIDFLRFVLYAGYKFDDRLLFNAEVEFEHASTGKGGEVSVEFAHVDYLLTPACNLRAGMLLVPMGIINEMHEPPTFFGANRPEVERRLIPTTWRANGAGVFGQASGRLAGLGYRAYVIESLSSVGDEKFTASGLRSGRQSGAQAVAEDFAGVVRADYERSGIGAGASVFFGNTSQGATDSGGHEFGATTTIYEAHAQLRRHGVTLRALVAAAHIDDAAAINDANGYTGTASVGEQMFGWYAEAGWDVLGALVPGTRFALVPYTRYSQLDTQQEVPAGFSADPTNDGESVTLGMSFFPHSQVVVKGDYEIRRNAADTGVDQWNLALGFHF